ncbi:hypothetical protein EJ04DRAFT_548878 [Polyplosphaeria fusca]|uniref:RRM domain-containing protein n=1 Tax=Polyplosphaeria fusca TaxID=682080 RepID=A0A9P4RA17_9PLEO|nr:hypothetical protein EJ04DRAFT_548878 [Polyplosphaeria fusca]
MSRFPRDIALFHQDDRISYSQADGVFLLVDEDGAEWEFNEKFQGWHQPATEEEEKAYRELNYPATPPEHTDEQADQSKKRKAPTAAPPTKKAKVEPEKANRAIYITNLPLDVTIDEVHHEFKKWGLVDVNENNELRITLHKDAETGKLLGSATLVYFRPESVFTAIERLHDEELRWGDTSSPGRMTVEEADPSYRKTILEEEEEEDADAGHAKGNKYMVKNGEGGKGGNGFYGAKSSTQKISKKERRDKKKKRAAQFEKLNRERTAWSDDEYIAPAPRNKFANQVIITGCFTLQLLTDEPEAILDISDDMREVGEECGNVSMVIVYDLEPTGIVVVRFDKTNIDAAEASAAQLVQKINQGPTYQGVKLVATVAQQQPRYQRSGAPVADD